ncbi:MAG TPA: TonB family protein [Anaeromyxobacter sp.]|nr:TonB family protein [Anaeromyxobacter sp.]
MAFLGPSLRRKRVTDRPAARVAAAALVSFALNALLLVLLSRLGAFDLPKPVQPTRVALEALSTDQWNANRAIAGASPLAPVRPLPQAQAAPAQQVPLPSPPPKVAPPPPAERRAKGQVVDVAPSPDSRPPDKTRFLSDRDNRVEKETRSRWAGTEVFEKRAPAPTEGAKGKQVAKGNPGEGGDAAETREAKAGQGGTAGKVGQEKPAETPAPEKRAPQNSEAPGPDERLAMLEPPARPGLPGTTGNRSAPRPPEADEGLGKPGAPGEAQAGSRRAGDPRLLPSVESMSRIAAGPSNDYIDRDIEEGDATALNTRAFKFATFWNRFKQDVTAHWRPAIVYQERDPNGTMFGDRPERATGLHVVLDAKGAIKDIHVTESSGLDFLDREAVRAVRAASPFYNVPAGLLDANNEVSFSFGMILVMNRAIPVRPHYGD